MKRLLCVVMVCCACVGVYAQKRTYTTKRINPQAPIIDGKIDETVWDGVEWSGEFTQHEPYEGKEPSQKTVFKILYDDKNLYCGIRAFDTEPEKIARRMSRRDDLDGDAVGILIDSYHDHLTAFAFVISASGVRLDGIFTNNGDDEDWSPDPVWYAKTNIDDEGWTTEMRIPLSQLRFSSKDEQVWGIQLARILFRKEETDFWVHVPKDAPGMVHLFGELHGISGIEPSSRIEMLPYAMGQAETFKEEVGNPFLPGHTSNLRFGLDGKIGVTSNLTLDLTVNPDFGQVEADPSVVNLTAFETFYQEKRPFFIEGSNILNYQIMGGDGDFSQDNLFYSRRIGRFPQYDPDLGDDEYADVPQNTTILGAMKLTGKTKNGLSIGLMDAVTQRERADIDRIGLRRQEIVEPMTNYFLGRLQKDFNEGQTKLGGIITHTYRDLKDDHLDFLNQHAITGGIDFEHSWKDRTYSITVNSIFSHVRGSEEAITRTQRSSVRYFQRPDADHFQLDSSRTFLSGHGGTINFNKSGQGHVNYATGVSWRSPGLDLNDMGYLRQTDKILQYVWVGYRWWDPFFIFRNFNINFNQWSGWDFAGENIFNGGNINLWMQFKNYWSMGGGINRGAGGISSHTLRGGPAFRYMGNWNLWYNIRTDSKKAIRFSFNGNANWNDDGISRNYGYRPGMTWQPSNRFSISLNPFYSINKSNLQYVDTAELSEGDRHLFGHIDQKTLGMVVRFNVSITPNLTIQYYGQPFVSAGKYTEFKRITDPRADAYTDRFHVFSEDELTYDAQDEMVNVDEDANGVTDYSFELPDFNFKQFRSNLVIRWEYTPGSTLFFVWSQNRTGYESTGTFAFQENMGDLFDVYPHDVFLIKINRWFSL